MESLAVNPTDLAAFDEILADLRLLAATLDHVVNKNSHFKAPSRPTDLAVSGKIGTSRRNNFRFGTEKNINGGQEEKLHTSTVLSYLGESGSRNNYEDNVITGQTHDYDRRVRCDDLLEAKMGMKNNKGFSKSNEKSPDSESTHIGTRKFDVTRTDKVTLQVPAKDMEYLNSDAGNCTSVDKGERQSKAPSSNRDSPSYLPKRRINGGESTKYSDNMKSDDCSEDSTGKILRISHSSLVISRNAVSTSKGRSTSRNTGKLEGRSRSHDEEVEKNSKVVGDFWPFQSRTLSLKRVFNRKLTPFRRPKGNLKSARSAPAEDIFHESSRNGGNPSTPRTDYIINNNNKGNNSVENSSVGDTSSSLCRRANSLDDSNNISDSDVRSNQNIIESHEPSFLCYKNRKTATGKDLSSQSSTKRSHSITKSNDGDLNSAGIISSSRQPRSGSGGQDIPLICDDHNSEGIITTEEQNNIPTNSSFTDIFKTASTSTESPDEQTSYRRTSKKSTDSDRTRVKEFSDRDNTNFRRSTIGSSYTRETGMSAANIYQNGLNYTGQPNRPQSLKNHHRHSLQGFKGQNGVSPAKNENRWSTEDGLLKDTPLYAQVQAHDNDKNFSKAGGIKPKSIFQKSTKSSKTSGMSSADRDKLTERTWNSMGKCTWGNMNSQRVELAEVDLLTLSESECVALQKIASQRLHDVDLGVSITIPKDESKLLNGKNNNSILKRRGVHLPLGTKNKSKKNKDHVFSIPLVRVVENDQLLRLQTDEALYSSGVSNTNDDDSLAHSSSEASPKPVRRMSSSLDSATEQGFSSLPGISPTVETFDNGDVRTSSPATPPNDSPASRRKFTGGNRAGRTLRRRGGIGLDINSEIDSEQSKLLESLMLSESSTRDKKRSLLPPTMPQVPYVVQKCCAHICKHGLDVTGIFRIAGSKKRVKQLREEFDLGVDVKIAEDYNSHDVAALLKEFFRDLPEALLTRELYQAFISTAKLTESQRLSALRCLVWLLPMPNRDTLEQLLSFLAIVSEHSEDRMDATGNLICGNKMGVTNLSTIFGPNILHRNKKTNPSSNETQYLVQSMERAEESTFVISVVDDMIRNHMELFLIPRETHDEILRNLQESDPDAVDYLLRRKAANYMRNESCTSPTDQISDSRATAEEVVKCFSADNVETPTIVSDMNNNNNNNSHHSNGPTLLKNHNGLDGVRHVHVLNGNRDDASDEIIDEINASHLTFPTRPSRSISFTDEDLNDILRVEFSSTKLKDGSRMRSFAEPNAEFRRSLESEKLSCPTTQRSLPYKTREASSAQMIELDGKHDPRSHVQYSRRQAFSLDPTGPKTRNGREEKVQKMPFGKAKRDDVRHPSSVSESFQSTTSGFVDMSSSHEPSEFEGDVKVTAYDNMCLENSFLGGKNTHVNTPIEIENTVIRKRLPSALNLHLNRTHGGDPSKSIHSLRIPKKITGKRSEENNGTTVGDTSSTVDLAERRISKDDMYLTLQEFRRRNQRRRNILI